MKRIFSLVIFLLSLPVAALPLSSAELIDFNDLASGQTTSGFSSNGFNFSDAFVGDDLVDFGPYFSASITSSTPFFNSQYLNGLGFQFQDSANRSFDLISATLRIQNNPDTVLLRGYLNDELLYEQTIQYDFSPDLPPENFFFNMRGIDKAVIFGDSVGVFAIDDILVRRSVNEPGSLALLVFALTGFVVCRRKRVA